MKLVKGAKYQIIGGIYRGKILAAYTISKCGRFTYYGCERIHRNNLKPIAGELYRVTSGPIEGLIVRPDYVGDNGKVVTCGTYSFNSKMLTPVVHNSHDGIHMNKTFYQPPQKTADGKLSTKDYIVLENMQWNVETETKVEPKTTPKKIDTSEGSPMNPVGSPVDEPDTIPVVLSEPFKKMVQSSEDLRKASIEYVCARNLADTEALRIELENLTEASKREADMIRKGIIRSQTIRQPETTSQNLFMNPMMILAMTAAITGISSLGISLYRLF